MSWQIRSFITCVSQNANAWRVVLRIPERSAAGHIVSVTRQLLENIIVKAMKEAKKQAAALNAVSR